MALSFSLVTAVGSLMCHFSCVVYVLSWFCRAFYVQAVVRRHWCLARDVRCVTDVCFGHFVSRVIAFRSDCCQQLSAVLSKLFVIYNTALQHTPHSVLQKLTNNAEKSSTFWQYIISYTVRSKPKFHVARLDSFDVSSPCILAVSS